MLSNQEQVANKAEQNQQAIEKYLLALKLADPLTSTEERISITRQLFPDEHKKEMLSRADKDKKGRPVRYFRLMSYDEFSSLFRPDNPNVFGGSNAKNEFDRRAREIKSSLRTFLENEGLYKELQGDYQKLCSDFTIEKFGDFVQKKLPLGKLLKLHQIGAYIDATGVTGLKSLSVGAPWNLPVDSNRKDPGFPVVEFSIPSEDVLVSPLSNNLGLQHREKEVNTKTLKQDWITDIYTGVQDIAERFFKDPSSVTYAEFQEQSKIDSLIRTMGYLGEQSIFELLGRWKESEPISDLIPEQRMSYLDGTSPDLLKPLANES
jgi:hypothetical protein